MSGLNYSKWDKLELSDDEDFECHPNVDKKSFIKWKQESIHQERAQRNHKIQQLEQRISANKKVMPMIEQAIESVKSAPEDKLEDFLDNLQEKVLEDNEKLQRKVAKGSSGSDKSVYNNAETPEDIFLSFLSFVQADIHKDNTELTKTSIQAKMVEELGKVKTHDEQCKTELEKEKKIKNSKLTSENLYKPGFDKTIVNKPTAVNAPPPASKPRTNKVQAIETLNQDSLDRQMESVNITESHTSQEDEDEDIEISDVALKFSELDTLQKSYEFISRNPYIIETRFQDEILAHALELELAKKPKASKLAVHQSLLLSYCEKLGRDGISIFFKGLHERGKGMFMEDVDNTYSILKKRCKVIEEEQRNQKEKAVFQLHLADPESKIVVNIPDDSEEQKQAKEIFDTLPKDFQEALKSSDLDIINKCLAEYDENDAENMLQICDQGGFLSFSVPPMESINQPPQQ